MFATITVDDNGDTAVAGDSKCTLREAITNANLVAGGDTTGNDCVAGAAGMDTIDFNIGAGTPSIAILGTELPAITQPVNINGSAGRVGPRGLS
jgi:CSLREA domain-containing protein